MQSREQDVKALIKSARSGDIDEVRRLLDLGVSPDAFCKDIKQEYQNKPQVLLAYLQNNNEFSRLISATENEAIFLKLMELIDFLIEKEIDLKAISQLLPDENTLQFAKFKECLLERFETLPINERIKLYDRILHTPDHPYYKLFRIQRGDRFYDKPCKPGKGTLREIEKALKKINELGTELYNAAFVGNLNRVNVLIADGASVNWANNKYGATPLFIAAQNGHLACVEAFLKAGANVNQACIDDGATPLYIAAQKGHLACVDALLKAGANVNLARSDGATPLFIAAQKGHLACVEALLKAGANVNLARSDGTTPLYIAAQQGHDHCVRELLKSGADANQTISDGRTPLSIAAQNGHDHCVRELLAHGADINAKFTRNEEVLRKFAGSRSKAIQARMNAFIDRQPNKNDIKITAEDMAYIMGHNNIVALLQQHRNAAAPVAVNELVTPSAPPLTNMYPIIHADGSISLPKHIDDSQREAVTPLASPPSYASLFPDSAAAKANSQPVAAVTSAPATRTAIEVEPVLPPVSSTPYRLFTPPKQTAWEQVLDNAAECNVPVMPFTIETEAERDARIAAALEALPSAPAVNESEDEPSVESKQQRMAMPG